MITRWVRRRTARRRVERGASRAPRGPTPHPGFVETAGGLVSDTASAATAAARGRATVPVAHALLQAALRGGRGVPRRSRYHNVELVLCPALPLDVVFALTTRTSSEPRRPPARSRRCGRSAKRRDTAAPGRAPRRCAPIRCRTSSEPVRAATNSTFCPAAEPNAAHPAAPLPMPPLTFADPAANPARPATAAEPSAAVPPRSPSMPRRWVRAPRSRAARGWRRDRRTSTQRH